MTIGQFGDTTLTKVFVGGLAWETPMEAMRDYFDQFGDILEAVIISDKITGRSKGYGFVTFRDAEAAKRACEDSSPTINGRRANCNLASLGARRPWSSSTPPPQQGVSNGGARSRSVASPTNPVQWYYPAPAGTPTTPFHHHNPQALPYYGYTPTTTYIPTDVNYDHKISYTSGTYMNGHFSHPHVYTRQAMMPMYPLYHYHQSQTMAPPAHLFHPATAGPMAALPAIISKPASLAPNPGGGRRRELEEER